MTQQLPSMMYQSQALALIKEFREFVANSPREITYETVSEKYTDIISRFSKIVGKPITQYDPLMIGEPLSSDKINKFIDSLQSDLIVLSQDIDLIRANTYYFYNFMSTELEKAKNQNKAALNKLKTLQLYTSSQKAEITVLGDFFQSEELFDLDKTKDTNTAKVDKPGELSIAKSNISTVSSLANAKITVLPTSNGFLGRLVELEKISTTSPITDSVRYRFKSQSDQKDNLNNIIDNSPATWFEYEKNLITTSDRTKAKNLNFTYILEKNIRNNKKHDIFYTAEYGKELDWADGPSSNVLKLDLEFDLKQLQTINEIVYTPYDLENNNNHPVLIKRIQLSQDRNSWEEISPNSVLVSKQASIDVARINPKIAIGSAKWAIAETQVRYIRISLEQSKSIASKIGHLYYTTPKVVVRKYVYDNNGYVKKDIYGNSITVEEVQGGERVAGPKPSTDNPTRYYSPSFSTVENNTTPDILNLIKNTETMDAQRWVIGINGISANKVAYMKNSVMISKPFKFSGIIDRVSLEANSFIPDSFGIDELWIKYYISGDDGKTWTQISRIQDDNLSLPEIIAFNDPIPNEFREEGVFYQNLNTTVNSLRVKIVLTRPKTSDSLSPIVYWYKLKVRKR